MKWKWIAAIAALALPLGISAGEFEPGRTISKDQPNATYSFTGLSDSEDLDEGSAAALSATTCGSVSIGFVQDITGGGGAGGAVTIRSVSSALPSANQIAAGTVLASFSGTSTGQSYTVRPGYLYVDVTGDPSGTSELYFYCAGNTMGSSGGAIPGLVGTIGNDATLDAVIARKTADPDLGHLTPVYFSFDDTPGCVGDLPLGDDSTGDGSRERPYRSFGRMVPFAQRGGFKAVLDPCDVAETNDGGAAGDNESAAFLLGANQNIVIDTRAAGVNHWSFCTDHTKVCFALISSDPARPVLIDPAMLDGTGSNTAFFSLAADAAITSRRGWLHIENVLIGTAASPFPRVNGCAASTDFIRMNTPFNVSMSNVDAYICGNNNELWTSHSAAPEADFGVFSNVNVYMVDLGGDYNAKCYWNLGSSAIAVLGGKCEVAKLNTTAGETNFAVGLSPGNATSSNYGFVYKLVCDHRPSNADTGTTRACWYVSSVDTNPNVQRLVVARSRSLGGGVAGNSGAWLPGVTTGTATGSVQMVDFRNSGYDQDAYIGLGATSISPNFSWPFYSRCSVQYAGPNGANRFVNGSNGGGNCNGLDLDVDDHFIEEASSVVGQIEAVTYTTIANWCTTAPATQACNGGAGSWTGCSMTDLTADPFGTLGAGLGVCTTAQCNNDCGHDLVESFQLGFYIPAHMVDGVNIITGVLLYGVGQPIGP